MMPPGLADRARDLAEHARAGGRSRCGWSGRTGRRAGSSGSMADDRPRERSRLAPRVRAGRGVGRGGQRARRALPDRRQLARLPRVLRAARVDRDVDRLPDQRDLRLRLDAREAADRARAEADDRRLGRGPRDARRSRRTTRPRAGRGRTCCEEQWPHLEPLVDAFGYRNIAVDGFEADDVIATHRRSRARRRGAGHGRHRRPRRLPDHRPRVARARSWPPGAGSPTPRSTTTRPSSTATGSPPSSCPTSTA